MSTEDDDTRRNWFQDWKAARRKCDRSEIQTKRPRLTDPWPEYLRHAQPCPGCRAAPDQLTWSYVHIRYMHPIGIGGYGFNGWMTVCKRCGFCVQRFGGGEWVS